MTIEALKIIYDLYVADGHPASLEIEGFLNCDQLNQSESERIALGNAYNAIFSPDSGQLVFRIFNVLMNRMRHLSYHESNDIITGLEFMQFVFATALWKYNFTIPTDFADFAREFDRLDVEEERQRLYRTARIHLVK